MIGKFHQTGREYEWTINTWWAHHILASLNVLSLVTRVSLTGDIEIYMHGIIKDTLIPPGHEVLRQSSAAQQFIYLPTWTSSPYTWTVCYVAAAKTPLAGMPDTALPASCGFYLHPSVYTGQSIESQNLVDITKAPDRLYTYYLSPFLKH